MKEREKIDGWCMDKDELGIPKLVECQVSKGAVAGVVFQQKQDKYGALLTTRTYEEGRTFFEDKRAGFRALRWELEEHYQRHKALLDYVAGQIAVSRLLMEK